MKIKRILLVLGLLGIIGKTLAQKKQEVKTTFQTASEWRGTIDNRADAVLIYGVGGNPSDHSDKVSFEKRVHSWREKGYMTQFMTGIAWGEYQDYFTGKWDGKKHLDEGQVTRNGDTIWHGYMVPYIVPTDNYLKYIEEEHVKRVIDAGIDAIFMEEPEFWARAGYSDAFKKAWKKYYGFDWRPQDASPENTYLSNKLKYWLYYHALKEVFTYAKAYGKSKGRVVKCYVATHSLINYSQWQIVSPEASLASLDCVDGYIAQIWTGTSREPNYYNGVKKERVFATAFLEYGSMESMTAPTGRKMFFLTDPVEDRARDWKDYKKNYQATFTAQLLYPDIANYEVMPWPERIYEGWYKTSAHSDKKEKIPRSYSSQMQVMINGLNKMPKTTDKVSGSSGISILMSNSLMFQRFPTHDRYKDPELSDFYGLALPLLKRGVPVKTIHLENVSYPQSLKDTKVLIMTYSNMKPMNSVAHKYIAAWVKKGGALLYCGLDQDPFQTVKEWWNTNGNHYDRPSDQLFEQMGIPPKAEQGFYKYGKGGVYILRKDPKEFALQKNNMQSFLDHVKSLYEKQAKAGKLVFKNNFYLKRGLYDLVAVMKESVSKEPFLIKGTLIDLYDPHLPVLHSKQVEPGEQDLLLNIDRIKDKKRPQVLAAASRTYDEKRGPHSYSYTAKSPIHTTNVSRVLLPEKPKAVFVNGVQQLKIKNWDPRSHTYLIRFENDPEGVPVEFKW